MTSRRCFGKLPAALLLCGTVALLAQKKEIVWSGQEKPILEQIRKLRSLPDDERARVTKTLATQIRELPAGPHREMLAGSLANLVTEGDPGAAVLTEVARTLAASIITDGYDTLAQLVRYEHVDLKVEDPRFAAAMAKLEDNDQQRQNADFSLPDLSGKEWTLKALRGRVVLVNFWATWCPPCRKEMPDLDALYRRFAPDGLVILAISDEEIDKVKPYLTEHPVSYPVLLDPGRKVNEAFRVEGIPKSFVYDRSGKLVAQAIDMRTERQFLAMLAQAGMGAAAH